VVTCFFSFELICDVGRQDFSQLNAPLVERVNSPDYSLDEYLVFVGGDELSE